MPTNAPSSSTSPMPENPEFDRNLSELKSHFLSWCMRQPWAAEFKATHPIPNPHRLAPQLTGIPAPE
jgi:hypothetical protein